MIVSIIVASIVFIILVNTIKATVRFAFMVAVLIVVLQVAYGITLLDAWDYIVNLPQNLRHWRNQ